MLVHRLRGWLRSVAGSAGAFSARFPPRGSLPHGRTIFRTTPAHLNTKLLPVNIHLEHRSHLVRDTRVSSHSTLRDSIGSSGVGWSLLLCWLQSDIVRVRAKPSASTQVLPGRSSPTTTTTTPVKQPYDNHDPEPVRPPRRRRLPSVLQTAHMPPPRRKRRLFSIDTSHDRCRA